MTDELRNLDYQRKTATIQRPKIQKISSIKKIILKDPSNMDSIRWTHSLKNKINKSKAEIYLEDENSYQNNQSELMQMKDIENMTNSLLEKNDSKDLNQIDLIDLKENIVFNEKKIEENKSNKKDLKKGK
jgi:hypothetical protein